MPSTSTVSKLNPQISVPDRFRNFVFGFALTLMVGWVLYVGRDIIIRIIASVIIAYILVAFARNLTAIPVIGDKLPAWLRFLISILVVVGFIILMVLLIANNYEQVRQLMPVYQGTLFAFITDMAARLGIETEPTWESIRHQIFGAINFQSFIGTTVVSVSSLIGNTFVVFIYAGFLLAERHHFANKLRLISGDPNENARILEIISEINDRIGNYLALKTLVNLILGALSWVIMFAIGIDFAAFWAVMIGLLNYVPYVGSFLGVLFPVGLAIVQFGALKTALVTLITLTLAQVFVGSVLEPRMMGRSLNLSPFVILVSLTVWFALWGIAGAILAIPITAVIVIVLSEFNQTRPIAIILSNDGRIASPRPSSS